VLRSRRLGAAFPTPSPAFFAGSLAISKRCNVPAFRSSLFSPRQSVGLKTLTQAVQQLEDLSGEDVDVEEGAIAAAFKKVASEELEKLYPLAAGAEKTWVLYAKYRDIVERVDPIFFSDPMTAAMKALGMT
jgi:hypothetical protein